MANQFRSAAEIISSVEAEFGEPFVDLLRQLAADGESIASAAGITGVTDSWLYRWLKANAPDIKWPRLAECNARQAAREVLGKSERHRRAASANIRRAWVVNERKFRAEREAHADLTKKAIELSKKGHGWRHIPSLLGVSIDPCTLRRRAKREYNYVSKKR